MADSWISSDLLWFLLLRELGKRCLRYWGRVSFGSLEIWEIKWYKKIEIILFGLDFQLLCCISSLVYSFMSFLGLIDWPFLNCFSSLFCCLGMWWNRWLPFGILQALRWYLFLEEPSWYGQWLYGSANEDELFYWEIYYSVGKSCERYNS